MILINAFNAIDAHFLSAEILRGPRPASRRGATDYFRVVISSFYLPSSFRRDREARQTANHNSYARGTRANRDDARRKKLREENVAGEMVRGKRTSRHVPIRVQETRCSPRTSVIIILKPKSEMLFDSISLSSPPPRSFFLRAFRLPLFLSLTPSIYLYFFLSFVFLLNLAHPEIGTKV